jgi:heme/copper-type cytochrome/quinol oxidase subunit 3
MHTLHRNQQQGLRYGMILFIVSEIMFFNDAAGQKVYQDHPLHMEFVKNCAHLWKKVLVYDAQDV